MAKIQKTTIQQKALELFQQNPTWGYRPVAKALREQFGKAIRDAELARIRQTTEWYKLPTIERQEKQFKATYYFTQNPDMSMAEVNRRIRAEFGRGTTGLRELKYSTGMTVEMVNTISEFYKKRAVRAEEEILMRERLANLPKPKGGYMPEIEETLYRKRANRLHQEGFMRWEWSWLAYHMISSPGMEKMRDGRKTWVARLIREGYTMEEIERKIVAEYERLGLFFLDGRLNPFALLEYYKKKDEPTPDTPQKKRRVARKDFIEGKKNSKGKRRN